MSGTVPKLRFPAFSDEWTKHSIGEIVLDYRLGGNYSNTDTPQSRFLIKMGNIGRGTFVFDKVQFVADGEQVDAQDLMQPGELFLNTRNTLELVGKVAIWKGEIDEAYFNSNLLRLTFACNGFMNWRLNDPIGISALKAIASGTTSVAAIYTGHLLKLKLYVPSLPEQQKIASFLAAVDGKISGLQRKEAALVRFKAGLMQKLFSQKLRFTRNDGSAFPDWSNTKADALFRSTSNKNHDGTLPILSMSQEGGAVLRGENGIDIKATTESILAYKIVEPGDFIISLRSFQGGIEYSEIMGICSPAYTVMKPNKVICDLFYKYFFKSRDFITRLSLTVVGIRDGKQISYGAFADLILPYPHPDEQRRIADALSAMDDKIAAVRSQISKMEAFKKGLLHQMFV